MLRGSKKRIDAWLKANPGWHYGLEVAQSAGVGRAMIYIYLSDLEELGAVERRLGPPEPHLGLTRTQYRAAVGKEPPRGVPDNG